MALRPMQIYANTGCPAMADVSSLRAGFETDASGIHQARKLQIWSLTISLLFQRAGRPLRSSRQLIDAILIRRTWSIFAGSGGTPAATGLPLLLHLCQCQLPPQRRTASSGGASAVSDGLASLRPLRRATPPAVEPPPPLTPRCRQPGGRACRRRASRRTGGRARTSRSPL